MRTRIETFFSVNLGISILLVSCIGQWPASLKAETTDNSGATELTSLPASITTPGTYYLKSDFSVNMSNGQAIAVNASGVTIDLNGHTVTNTYGLANTAAGIAANGQAMITVRNGTITGFCYGVIFFASSFDASSSSYGHLVENVSLVKETFCAVDLQGFGSRIYRCRAVLTGGTTNQSGYIGLELDGASNSIVDCDVCGKSGAGAAYGIYIGSGSDNFVVNNRISSVDYGVNLYSGGLKYRDNLTSGVITSYTGGTDAGNNQ